MFAQNLASYNKNNGVLLSQAFRNLTFKLHIRDRSLFIEVGGGGWVRKWGDLHVKFQPLQKGGPGVISVMDGGGEGA